ncbi:hypothetical protein DD565_06610 [Vibrio cholerae]|uniref:hypothetical protein n=1 Tax=Vibrio TaxID=662 RepID=UPI000D5D444D|nr:MULTISPECIES: hypothetical protein [Vibrio]EHD2261706.1 hypothetical protein [Vibrio cholerae]EKB0633414.1 hypothetical protein [Vibrio cholerae]NNN49748.1 hypothetical protein [Vibrio sp. 2-2(8)]PVX18373.1 hypothetical protein DD565_06610 [Vibrio cholerae]
MEWFFKLARIVGASSGFTAPFVQAQAEVSSAVTNQRLDTLEDPIGRLHSDIQDVCKGIYDSLRDSVNLNFSSDFYEKYRRCLVILDSQGLISLEQAIGTQTILGVNLINPIFIQYVASKCADNKKLIELNDLIENCEIGQTMDANSLSEALDIPRVVICSLFEIYETKKLGICSGGLVKTRYRAIA